MKSLLAALPLMLAAVPALAQAPVIDNPRVTVRDVTLAQGQPAAPIPHAGDYIVLYEKGGRIRDSSGQVSDHADGSAMSGHGGATADTAVGAPAHEVVVELKDGPSNTVPNNTGLPPAFPRPGSKLVLETNRVRVWNYAWQPGQPTPMHFHGTEVVVIYLGDGDVTSTTPDGKATVNHHNPRDIVFNAANRSHSEALTRGVQSGIMLELK